MVLKVFDEKEEQEGWIWFDHVKAIKRVSGQRYCVAREVIEKPDSDVVSISAGIYPIKDHKGINRDVYCPLNKDKSAFGCWMFSYMSEVDEFNFEQYTEIRFLDVIYESGEEQRLILRKGHPSCYLLSDSGKTIERI